jgi:hypothetical protein
MKKIKSISILLEQGPPDLSALQSGTITTPTTQPTDGKRKTGDKKNDGSGTTQPDQESSSPSQEELKTKPPYVDLLKLPGSQIKEKVDFSGETWENCVSWELKDKPAFNPTAKTAQDVNRDYFFKGDPANPDVKVFWKKTATSGYEPHLLYSGNYQLGGGKLTLSGSSGQKEIIDLATGKIDSTNVAILPSSTDPNAYAQDINLAKANLSRNTTGFNSWYFNMKMFNYKTENPGFRAKIIEGISKLGNPQATKFSNPTGSTWAGLDKINMTISMDYVDKQAKAGFGFWPVAQKFLSQFGGGQRLIVFGSITDISQPVNVKLKTDGKENFASGTEYLAYKLEIAARDTAGGGGHSNSADGDGINSVFSDDEALAFWYCLAALSQGVVNQLNAFAKDGGYNYKRGEGDTWSAVVLNEVAADMNTGESYKNMYDKYISALAKNNGKQFDEQTMASLAAADGVKDIDNTLDARFFKIAEDLYRVGETHLVDAMASMAKYVKPEETSHYVK